MKAIVKTASVALVTTVLLAGCTYVTLEPGAGDVKILSAARTRDCEKLGETTVSVATQIGFIDRGEPAIHKDLKRLARNAAVELGGDTLTPLTQPKKGEQTFAIYNCI